MMSGVIISTVLTTVLPAYIVVEAATSTTATVVAHPEIKDNRENTKYFS